MKNKWNILIALIFLVGVLIVLYPIVSNMLAAKNHTKLIKEYQITTEHLSEQTIKNYFDEAETYNSALLGIIQEDSYVSSSGYGILEGYSSILNINGFMGYIEIPVVNIRLPIFHTVHDNVLKKGVGHMEQTAFPIGGVGNHSVLTAHRGLPSAKLFTDLNKVEEGDFFYIYILNRTLIYEVNQVLIVEPENTQPLVAMPDEDYVTLITCTPYGINSHRILVRGTRIIEMVQEDEEQLSVTGTSWSFYWIILMILLIMIFLWILKKKAKQERGHYTD